MSDNQQGIESIGYQYYLTICWMASGDGGTGKSGGRCGNKERISSGWLVNRGVMLAGVMISVRESTR